uniref:Uncharacterized protein n=1 Tax=Mycena chlorophos TaxID=658473 RepID=A0ABQ0M106_MYCCL|nr:predicted protein [Mycena chlorophos]
MSLWLDGSSWSASCRPPVERNFCRRGALQSGSKRQAGARRSACRPARRHRARPSETTSERVQRFYSTVTYVFHLAWISQTFPSTGTSLQRPSTSLAHIFLFATLHVLSPTPGQAASPACGRSSRDLTANERLFCPHLAGSS